MQWGVKKSRDVKTYGDSIGVKSRSIQDYVKAAEVYSVVSVVKEQNAPGCVLLMETKKLVEISKLPETDWLWMHDFIVKNECSKNQVTAAVKAVREYRDAAAEHPDIEKRFLQDVKVEEFAEETLTPTDSDRRKLKTVPKFIQRLAEASESLGTETVFYSFSPDSPDEIAEWTVNPAEMFCERMADKKTNINTVNQVHKEILHEINTHTRERAQADYDFYHTEEMQRIREDKMQAVTDGWKNCMTPAEIAEETGNAEEDVAKIIDAYRKDKGIDSIDILHGDMSELIKGFADPQIYMKTQ